MSIQSKSQNNTKNALGIISKVSGALLKQLAAGDKPKAISSPSLDLSVGRKTLEGISGTGDDDKDSEAGEGMGGVRLPNPGGLFGGANASLEDGATSAIGSTVRVNQSQSPNRAIWFELSSLQMPESTKKTREMRFLLTYTPTARVKTRGCNFTLSLPLRNFKSCHVVIISTMLASRR